MLGKCRLSRKLRHICVCHLPVCHPPVCHLPGFQGGMVLVVSVAHISDSHRCFGLVFPLHCPLLLGL